MALEIVRRIRGNVHGSIDISAVEDRLLEHPCVQRLRRIRQLAFLSYVFPGATHTRFEHSLGVMQLAGVAWEKLKANQARLRHNVANIPDFAEREAKPADGILHGVLTPTFAKGDVLFDSDYTVQALRLAAFLHDLGHPPFSHSGERFLPTWAQVLAANKSKSSQAVLTFLQKKCDEIADAGIDPTKTKVRHEVFTILMVDRVLADLYRDFGKGIQVAPQDVIAIINPNIPPESGSPLEQHGGYKLLNEMISGEFDIDRMDYLLRDSRECGVVYGIFDDGRILDSLTLYQDPQDESLHLAITMSGLAAFEDYLRARYSMYLQLYFHKTSVAAEAMLQSLGTQLGGWHLPADVDAYAEVDEYRIAESLRQAANSQITDPEAKEQFLETLDDLLYRRRLWKRVFEVSSADKEELPFGTLKKAQTILDSLGYRHEQVSSKSSLTRFIPRGENQFSHNYLRLIKKDARQVPRVVPIEDHSPLIRANDRVYIRRIYMERGRTAAEDPVSEAKQTLTKQLLQET